MVASEVRALAQRSAQAAREIKTLIATSVGKTEAGSRLASETGEAMRTVVNAVHEVHSTIETVSTSTADQAHRLSQVTGNVVDIDQSTQQNAALVEQYSAAADGLKHQAQVLADAVSRFKV